MKKGHQINIEWKKTGQLCLGKDVKDLVSFPRNVTNLSDILKGEKVVGIDASKSNTIVVTKKRVFACGSALYGIIGEHAFGLHDCFLF